MDVKSNLPLIIQILHNHHHNTFFCEKIEQSPNYLSSLRKEILKNSEIFNKFKSKRIIFLYFIKILKSILGFAYSNTVYYYFDKIKLKNRYCSESNLCLHQEELEIYTFMIGHFQV